MARNASTEASAREEVPTQAGERRNGSRPAQPAEPPLAVTVRDGARTLLDVCRRCTRFSQEAVEAQAEMLKGLGTAMAAATASIDAGAGWNEFVAQAETFWGESFDQVRRRQADLPYAATSLWYDLVRIMVSGAQEGLEHSGGIVGPSSGIDPSQLMVQARASLDQWMQQWAQLWQAQPAQVA